MARASSWCASNRDLPVVMVSARKDRDSVIADAQQRVSASISKPLSANTVQQRLQPPAVGGV